MNLHRRQVNCQFGEFRWISSFRLTVLFEYFLGKLNICVSPQWACWSTQIQTDRQTDGLTDRQTGRPADRQVCHDHMLFNPQHQRRQRRKWREGLRLRRRSSPAVTAHITFTTVAIRSCVHMHINTVTDRTSRTALWHHCSWSSLFRFKLGLSYSLVSENPEYKQPFTSDLQMFGCLMNVKD